MRNFLILLAAAVLAPLLLTSCDTLGSIMVDSGAADQLLAEGAITPEQHAALTGNGWGPILQQLINTATTLLIGIPVIQKWRGPATKSENVEKKALVKAAKAAD